MFNILNLVTRKKLTTLILSGSISFLPLMTAYCATEEAGSSLSISSESDDIDVDSLLDLSALEEEVNIFGNQTIYSASKYAQKKSDAPSSVSVLTADDIQNHGWRNLAEALRTLPGFYSTYDREYHHVGVRGFNRPGDYNSRILLLVNGQRMNENIFGSAALGNDFAVDMDMIKQIEVIRGPSASIYGSSAFFAVVNVMTRSADDIDGTELSASAGSFDTSKGNVIYGKKVNNVGVTVSASRLNSGGQDYQFEEYSQYNGGNSTGNDREQTSQFFAQVETGKFSFQLFDSKRNKHVPTGAYGTEFNDSRSKDVDQHSGFDAKYNLSLNNEKNITARAYYNKYTYDGYFPYDYGPPDGVVLNSDYAKGELWGTEFQLTQPIDEHKITYGADFRQNIHQDQRNFDVEDGTTYLDDKRSEQIWALYFQGEFKLAEKLTLNAGLRHDDYETHGGTTNPRLGLIYSANESTTWKFLYGEAFKTPTAFEKYYDDDGETSLPNPDLEPEEIDTIEVVFEKTLSSSMNVSASAFSYKIDNLITQVEDPQTTLFIYENIDKVSSKGIEVELLKRLGDGKDIRIGGSWQDTVDDTTDRQLTNSPKQLAHVNFTVPLNKPKDNDKGTYSAGIEFLYVGERTTLDDDKAGAYGLTNLNITGRKLIYGMDLSVNVYNLFDKEFEDPTSGELEQDTITQDGRAFSMKLTTKF